MESTTDKYIATSFVCSVMLLLLGAGGMYLFGTGLSFLICAVMWMLGVAGLLAAIIGSMLALLVHIWRT